MKGKTCASLLVTIDHPNPMLYILDYDSNRSGLVVSQSLSLKGRAPRPSEYYSGAVLHPNGQLLVTSQYTGLIKVVVLGNASNVIKNEFECR